MPIFEFICKNCGLKFESLVRGSEQVECPKCNRSDLRKLVSNFAFSSRGDPSRNITSSSSGCAGCSSGNCSSCSR